MDKRKLFVSILAGIMAAVMLLGLVASFIPTRVSAATSSELKVELDKLKEDKKLQKVALSGISAFHHACPTFPIVLTYIIA